MDVQDHNNGFLQNGLNFGTGNIGQAFVLDGIDDYVHIGDPENLNFLSSITLEGWVNPTSSPPPDDRSLTGIFAIITKWGQSRFTDAYGIWLHNPYGNVRLIGGIGVLGVSDGGVSGGIVPLGQWSHVAMTYDGATGLNRLYLNGVQVAERTRTGGIASSDLNVLIGKEDSILPRFFHGGIDELTFYNRVLSPSEIQSIFAASGQGKCKPSGATIKVEKFFTDPESNPLPVLENSATPKVDVILAKGIVHGTNPGQVGAWVRTSNTGKLTLQSIALIESLPLDWIIHPSWSPAVSAVRIFFQLSNGTMLDITDSAPITVTGGNPQTVAFEIADISTTLAGKGLSPGESILLSVKLNFALRGTIQTANSFPRNYTDSASAVAFTDPTFAGAKASSNASSFFTGVAKVLGDGNHDLKVDVFDAATLAYSYGSRRGGDRWNADADFDGNGIIDILDAGLLAFFYGTGV